MTDVTPRPKQGKRRPKKPPPGWWPLDEAAEFVITRSRGLCEGDTPACPHGAHRGEEVHHKAGRRGVDPHHPSKLLHLCSLGHRYAHSNVAESYRLGLLVKRLGLGS